MCASAQRLAISSQGIAVGEWFYDPTTPPDGDTIAVRVLESRLFHGQ